MRRIEFGGRSLATWPLRLVGGLAFLYGLSSGFVLTFGFLLSERSFETGWPYLVLGAGAALVAVGGVGMLLFRRWGAVTLGSGLAVTGGMYGIFDYEQRSRGGQAWDEGWVVHGLALIVVLALAFFARRQLATADPSA